eukprot:scaffold55230_cov16-Tisochrysis_lutea.AAC.2
MQPVHYQQVLTPACHTPGSKMLMQRGQQAFLARECRVQWLRGRVLAAMRVEARAVRARVGRRARNARRGVARRKAAEGTKSASPRRGRASTTSRAGYVAVVLVVVACRSGYKFHVLVGMDGGAGAGALHCGWTQNEKGLGCGWAQNIEA